MTVAALASWAGTGQFGRCAGRMFEAGRPVAVTGQATICELLGCHTVEVVLYAATADGQGPTGPVRAGDHMPEAATWGKARAWLKDGVIRPMTGPEVRELLGPGSWWALRYRLPVELVDPVDPGVGSDTKTARVKALLVDTETRDLSCREIARRAGCSHGLVDRIRRAMGSHGGRRRYRTRHGTWSEMDTTNIGGS